MNGQRFPPRCLNAFDTCASSASAACIRISTSRRVRRGVIVSSDMHAGTPSYAAAELTWALTRCDAADSAADRRAQGGHVANRCRPHPARSDARHLRLRPNRGDGRGVTSVRDEGAGGREESRRRARADGYETSSSKEAFFEDCDIVSLHMRLVDATRGIVTAADLARMKTTALLVNTSRAGLIEPGALVSALEQEGPDWQRSTCSSRSLFVMASIRCSPWIAWCAPSHRLWTREEMKPVLGYLRPDCGVCGRAAHQRRESCRPAPRRVK